MYHGGHLAPSRASSALQKAGRISLAATIRRADAGAAEATRKTSKSLEDTTGQKLSTVQLISEAPFGEEK